MGSFDLTAKSFFELTFSKLEMRCFELVFCLAITLCMTGVIEGGQPSWSTMLQGSNQYTLATETWEECGFLCTKNYQRVEQSLVGTTCSAWSWYDPSNRHYSKLCRFYDEEHTFSENGQVISGVSGCYSLSTC